MTAIIEVTTRNSETSYRLVIGHQSFPLAYVYDDQSNDTAKDHSLWYADQLKIALQNARCKEVEIVAIDLNKQ